MQHRLPDDPTALLHSVACLLEVVAPDLVCLAREVPEGAEAEGDSEDGRCLFTSIEQRQAAAAAVAGIPMEALRLRITVFAAGENL